MVTRNCLIVLANTWGVTPVGGKIAPAPVQSANQISDGIKCYMYLHTQDLACAICQSCL